MNTRTEQRTRFGAFAGAGGPPANPIVLSIYGCGAAGSAMALAYASGPLAARTRSILMVDKDRVEEKNALTTPVFKGAHGPKSGVLEAAVARRLDDAGAFARTHSWCSDLRLLPLKTILSQEWDWRQGEWLIHILALDDWDAELSALQMIRDSGEDGDANRVLALSIGLGRGEYTVTRYGPHHSDACPACGVGSLPGTVSCVREKRKGDLSLPRGDMIEEARAAADTCMRLIERWAGPQKGLRPPASKSLRLHYIQGGEGRRWSGTMTRIARVQRCYGPHYRLREGRRIHC